MGIEMKLNIIFEDNHIIVVEKPVGVLSQEDHTQDDDMLTLIKHYIKTTYNKPGNVFLGLIHRLDRMVGGVMVFAKTSKAASRLSEQVRTHQVEKNYLAVVHGNTPKIGTLKDYLLKNPDTNMVKAVSKDTPGSKYAELNYQQIDYKDSFSLVKVELITGRSHQIRVQFSNLGHPLYGDKRYGKGNDKGDIALYAYELSFYHPTTKAFMTFKRLPTQFPYNKFRINT
jgi:23S rRNA pseudouridine1911/1915/1917 synthase